VVTLRFNNEYTLHKSNHSNMVKNGEKIIHEDSKTTLIPHNGNPASIESDHTYTMSSATLTAGMTTCSTCGIWVSMARLEQHIKRQHKHKYNKRQFQCRQCGKLSKCQKALMIHISKYHQDLCSNQKGFITETIKNCSYINKLENKEQSINTDKISPPHSPEDGEMNVKKMVKCRQCGILLNNYSNLKWHLKRVHSQLSVFCPKCKCYFPTNHLNKNHPELREHRFYMCRLCDRQFLKESDNLKHLEREHTCRICNTIFSSGRGIEARMKDIHKECHLKTNKMLEISSKPAKGDDKLESRLSVSSTLCGKCGSYYERLRLHKQVCAGVNSAQASIAGIR
jgi:hypothetical protein